MHATVPSPHPANSVPLPTLDAIGLADAPAARHVLQRLLAYDTREGYLAQCLPALLHTLATTADPDRVLMNIERLFEAVTDRALLARDLARSPRLLEMLITLFAGSQYLADILIRRPHYLTLWEKPRRFSAPRTSAQLREEVRGLLAPCVATPTVSVHQETLAALRRYQQGEFLRIGTADLLGMSDMPTTTAQLAHLADALTQGCLDIAALRCGCDAAGFVVLGLGKLGGEELNYSSDIDLVFLAQADAAEYVPLGQALIDGLSQSSAEGYLYRVDMRLRPWGRAGALVVSTEGYLNYLQRNAGLWEKQALLKARPIAGDLAVGYAFLRRAEPLLFDAPHETVRADVHQTKQRIEAQLPQREREWGEVKLGKGSIRDVEFVTQYLQLAHGVRHPEVRGGNTLHALAHLATARLIPSDDYRVLADGYTFLRPVEHYLQIMHYRQTHMLPNDIRELTTLAKRLGFPGEEAGAHFVARYQQHSAAIREVYLRYLEQGTPLLEHSASAPLAAGETAMSDPDAPRTPDVRRHLERMEPSYAVTFSAAEILRHAELAERLSRENIVEIDAAPREDGAWRVTIVAYDYAGELALICGLLFAYGFSIRDGQVFTYEPLSASPVPSTPWGRGARHSPSAAEPEVADAQRKIVDVFTVEPALGLASPDQWPFYADDLTHLLRLLQHGQRGEAQGELAKRVALAYEETAAIKTTLQPVDIEIDNDSSPRYTVLRIEAPDTIGFLYEFTSALALNGVHIGRVIVESTANRASDTLYLTDTQGRKITAPEKQRELRVATVLVKHFTHLLPHSPNPESALLHFSELLSELFARPDWTSDLATLERPEVLSALARLLGVSDFLWDDFLRMQYANLLPVVSDVEGLALARPRDELQREGAALLHAAPDGEAKRAALNAFKDREMFRVDMRHIQGHIPDFGQFSAELTDLAEVVVEAATQLCEGELRARHGAPLREDGAPAALSVCALGKCGGRELGYASDIELLFVYEGRGATSGPAVLGVGEFYEQVVEAFLSAIHARREGIFEIDLRLRPYGEAGSMAVSEEAFRRYFAPGGPAWPYERQALIKLRPITGDGALGGRLLALRDEFVYGGESFDVAAMRAMRERQLRHLVTGGTFNAKFSLGGLVDAEYLVQGLQMRHGQANPSLRLTNTQAAIQALARVGILSAADEEALSAAYVFVRRLIDALRMVRGNAKDLTVPPAASDEFAYLARRLAYGDDLAQLRQDLTRHAQAVQELNVRLLG